MLGILQGYKTYIVGIIAIVYAVASLWGGVMDAKSATDVILGALGLMGVRSGITTAIIQLLQAQGHAIPTNGGQAAIKKAIAAVKNAAPAILAIVLLGSIIMGTAACSTLAGKSDPQSILNDTESGFALAEAAYDGICAVAAAPSFCTDPAAQAAYASAKLALERLFATTQAAIDASNNTDTAAIESLLAQISQDWMAFNKIVNTVQAKNAALKGASFTPIPLHR